MSRPTDAAVVQPLFAFNQFCQLARPVSLGASVSRPITWLEGDARSIPVELRAVSVKVEDGDGDDDNNNNLPPRALVKHAEGYRAMIPYLLNTRAALVLDPLFRAALAKANFAIAEARATVLDEDSFDEVSSNEDSSNEDSSDEASSDEDASDEEDAPRRGTLMRDFYTSRKRQKTTETPAVKARRQSHWYFAALQTAMKMTVEFWQDVLVQARKSEATGVWEDFGQAQEKLDECWPADRLSDPRDYEASGLGLLWTSDFDWAMCDSTVEDLADSDTFVGEATSLSSRLVEVEMLEGHLRSAIPPEASSEIALPVRAILDGLGGLEVQLTPTREFDAVFGHLWEEDYEDSPSPDDGKKTGIQWLFIQQSIQQATIVDKFCDGVLDALRRASTVTVRQSSDV